MSAAAPLLAEIPDKIDFLVVGGGAGGLELAVHLGKAFGRRRVLLVDRSPAHVWKPTLHEVAAGTLDSAHEGLNYLTLARRGRFNFALGELAAFDPSTRVATLAPLCDAAGAVVVPARRFTFGTAILCIGSGTNFFGTPGAEHAHILETTRDAQQFHRVFLQAFMRAAARPDPAVKLTVVGAGATGVELAAELVRAAQLLAQTLMQRREVRAEVTLVEAASRILSALPEEFSTRVAAELTRQGVTVQTGAKVLAISQDGVETDHGFVAANLVVWAAGVKAADANASYGLPVNKLNQFLVDDCLETEVRGIFALGDCAACRWGETRWVPARAQAAHQQASALAKELRARDQGHRGRPFKYRDFGSLVSLGKNGAFGMLGGSSRPGLTVDGIVASCMYAWLRFSHSMTILGFGKSTMLWLANRLQGHVAGRLKLH